jgi:hypothetical protein
MNSNKLLSIWENYWGKLSPEWAQAFLEDMRVPAILNDPELLILQAIQQNRKLADVLSSLEKNNTRMISKLESDEFMFSRTIVDKRVNLGTDAEVNEIKQWLMEFARDKLSQDAVVTWLNVRTDAETCKAKKRYETEKDAILALIRLGKQNGEVIKQLPYKCNICRQYHNSHLLSRETIDNLNRKYS